MINDRITNRNRRRTDKVILRLVCLLGFLFLVPQRGFAYLCETDVPNLSLIMPSGAIPMNSRLYIHFTGDGGMLSHFQFQLESKKGSSLETKSRVLPGSLVELIPKKKLAPSTEYRVRATVTGLNMEGQAGNWTKHPTNPEAFTKILGAIQTADREDREAPGALALLGGRYLKISLSTDAHEEEIFRFRMTVPPPKDDFPHFLYQVWIVNENQSINYQKRPSLVTTGMYRGVEFGGINECEENFIFPKGSSTLRVGVRAVDYAGHEGTPSETVISLKHSRRLMEPSMAEEISGNESPICQDPQVAVLPSSKEPVPLNTQVRIQKGKPPFRITLDRKTVESSVSQEGHVAVLSPKANLLPEKTYQILDRSGSVVSKFTTAKNPAIGNPLFEIPAEGKLVRGIKENKETESIFHYQFISIPLVEPRKPLHQESLWYEVWSAPREDLLDVSMPPEAVVWTYDGKLKLGYVKAGCGWNFYIPAELDTLYLAIRAVDVIGNHSEVKKVKVDLRSMGRVSTPEPLSE